MPTYVTEIYPHDEKAIIGIEETTPGVAAAVAYQDNILDGGSTCTHQIVEVMEKLGAAMTHTDRVETVHECSYAESVEWHAGGHGLLGLMQMHGSVGAGGADTVTGTVAPYTHAGTMAGKTNRLNTATIWYDMGDGVFLMHAYAVIEEWTLSWAPGSPLQVSMTWRSFFPNTAAGLYTGSGEVTYAPPPTGSNLLQVGKSTGSTGKSTYGYQANYDIRGSGGSTYSNKVWSGQISIRRPVTVKYGTDPTVSYGSQSRRNPIDIVSEEPTVTGTLDMQYDGQASGTAYNDYLKFQKLGTSGNPNKIKFIDSDGQTLEIVMWPIYFDADTPAKGTTIDMSMAYQAVSDRGNLIQTTPVATILNATATSPFSGTLIK